MLVTADASELLLAYSECEILYALVCFCVLVPLQPLLKLFLGCHCTALAVRKQRWDAEKKQKSLH